MPRTVECASCETEFEVKTWISGECPKCTRGYYWEEEYNEGLDSYTYVVWED